MQQIGCQENLAPSRCHYETLILHIDVLRISTRAIKFAWRYVFILNITDGTADNSTSYADLRNECRSNGLPQNITWRDPAQDSLVKTRFQKDFRAAGYGYNQIFQRLALGCAG